jgi:hypothetical protein
MPRSHLARIRYELAGALLQRGAPGDREQARRSSASEAELPELDRHRQRSIRTGAFCSYVVDSVRR